MIGEAGLELEEAHPVLVQARDVLEVRIEVGIGRPRSSGAPCRGGARRTSSAIESPVICPTMSSRAVSSAALASGQPTRTASAVARCFLHLDRIGSDEMRAKVHMERSRVAFDGPGEHRPRRRLAPAGEARIGRHLEEDAPDPGDVAAPVRMNGPYRDVHDVDAEGFDLLAQ